MSTKPDMWRGYCNQKNRESHFIFDTETSLQFPGQARVAKLIVQGQGQASKNVMFSKRIFDYDQLTIIQ